MDANSQAMNTARLLYEVLPDGSWANKPCFVVGGGPSLSDFDWSLLRGNRVIGINRVFEKFDPTIIFSMDHRFLRWILKGQYGKDAIRRFRNSAAYKVWLCTKPGCACKVPAEIFLIGVWGSYSKGFKAFPVSMRDGIGHGNNSGYAALNLAVCLGANPIYLIGFDMKRDGEKTHWHSGHPIPMRQTVLDNFRLFFNHAALKTRAMGVKVINLNPHSALACFPKKRIKEILN